MDVLIGCSGYSYDDWKGTFYPPDLKKGVFLKFYERHFPIVEINATYYTYVGEKSFRSMIGRTERLLFSVKLHRDFTHGRVYSEEERTRFLSSLKPLVERGRLKALLAQFPYSFHYSTENLDYVRRLRDDFQPLPMAIEFRNSQWKRDDVFDAIEEMERTALVNVDAPPIRGLFTGPWMSVGEFDYIRLHGRNATKWYNHREAWERYDYEYSQEELKEIARRITSMKNGHKMIFFNNHYRGKGPRNARKLMEILGMDYGNTGGMQRLFV